MSSDSLEVRLIAELPVWVEVSKCIVDEEGLITLTVLNRLHSDDRNNVIDLEGVTFEESQQIIADKHDTSLPDMEMRELLFVIGVSIIGLK